jgi:hypothetical protein
MKCIQPKWKAYRPRTADIVKVEVTLRLAVCQPVCLGVVPLLGHMTRNLFYFVLNFKKVTVLSMWAPGLVLTTVFPYIDST